MAKLIIDSQTIYVLCVVLGVMITFFYGVHLAYDDTMDEDYAGTLESSIAEPTFNGTDYEGDMSSDILVVNTRNATLFNWTIDDVVIPEFSIQALRLPVITVPEARFTVYNIFDYDFWDNWFSSPDSDDWMDEYTSFQIWEEWEIMGGDLEQRRLWNEQTFWEETTLLETSKLDFSVDYTAVDLEFNVNRFGDNMFPDYFSAYSDLQDTTSDMPMIVGWILVLIPLGVILVIIRTPDVSVA